MLSAWLLLSLLASLVYGFVRLNAKARRLEDGEAATLNVVVLVPYVAKFTPPQRAAFDLGERMRLAFRLRQPKPVDAFTTKLEWAFATQNEEVRS